MSLQATEERVAILEQHPDIPSHTLSLLKSFSALVSACEEDARPRVLRRTAEVVEEVVFEAEIDGTHFYLVRCQPQRQPATQISLSPREMAIARLVVKGLPNKSIGDILDISPWTVATHLRRIFSKLAVTTRASMVARLLEENML